MSLWSWWKSTPKPKHPEPKTLVECLRQTAEMALERGDLVTRGDCLQAISEINRLKEQRDKAYKDYWDLVTKMQEEGNIPYGN